MQRKAAICDDNLVHLNEIKTMLEETGCFSEITEYSALEAIQADIAADRMFDLVFMDFEWEQQTNGIDLAALLQTHCPAAQVVFVTSYPLEYVQQVFFQKINLAGFLCKPVEKENLNALLRALDSRREFFELPVNGHLKRYFTDEVTYIDSHDHYVQVHHTDHTTESIRISTIEAEKRLPACYFRCHKSYLVNLFLVSSFDHKDIVLCNGDKVYLARSKYNEFREALFRFIGHAL